MENEILEILKDLTFINAVIATELLRITENTASIANKPAEKVAQCTTEHQKLSEKIIQLVQKYQSAEFTTPLKTHNLGH
ncbi:MAG: hypothetical protein ACTSRS_17525 [Candidatus Helarchaeota archaeon]